MEQHLKERMVGAGVLIVLAAIFVPMILSDEPVMKMGGKQDTDPAGNTDLQYHSSVVPVQEDSRQIKPRPLQETTEDPLPLVVEKKQLKETLSATQKKTDKKVDVVASDESKSTNNEPGESQAKRDEDIKTDVGTTQAWVVQLGSFSSDVNALALNERLLKHKFPSFIEPMMQGDKVIYRVRVGPMLQKEKIEKIKVQIKKTLNKDGILIKYP